MNRLPLFLLLACCIMGASPTAQASESEKPQRQVSVQGKGKIKAVPDIARISIEVVRENQKIEPANNEVRRAMEAILRVLRNQGVQEKDIQTDLYRVTPKIQWKEGRSLRNGYVVSNRITVIVRDLKKTGSVLSAVLDAGANNVRGPEFDFDNPQELERKAMAMALTDARAKAELLAQTAGAKLGDVITIHESGGGFQPRPMMMRSMAVAEARDTAAPDQPISAGEEIIEAMVGATFELR